MRIKINGESIAIKTESRKMILAQIVKELGYHPQLIVIEFNGEIIENKSFETQEVKNGDSLEIVSIVGGGS